VVSDAGIHPLPPDVTVLDLVRAGLPAAMEAGAGALAQPAVPLDAVRLLPPLAAPTVRDFVAFEEHVDGLTSGEIAPEWYQAPTFYFTNPYALVGAHDDVPVPPGSQLLDFELEVAVVVGKDGASLTPEQAREHIFGYTVLNDWSARDLQRREMKVLLGPAKGKDSATTLGPWLVTADELEPYLDGDGFLALDLRAYVNGELIGQDLLSNMGWPFEELISYASRGTVVRAGDVLGSGTCGNGGCLAELWGRGGRTEPPPLRPGDVVELTVEGIGSVRNKIVPGLSLPPVREARTRSVPRVRERAD
jgi:2-keto-4-pentenoate hydratase/2-oxohepta-3-ene-1,7-dioic acid hydratase in catechol pathway